MEHAIMCPQCNAPLEPHRFARSIVCSYCGAVVQLDESTVPVSLFREAFRVWNALESYQFSSYISTGNRNWTLEQVIAQGDSSDVYTGRLARFPTELVIIKLLRDRQNLDRFENEWNTLQALQQSKAPGADTFTMLLPQPVIHGDITAGAFAGRRVNIFRRAGGFHHTFDAVIRAYPQGIPPRASIWVWRRILEMLSFIHASGMAHGAVLPAHLLIQENEHGVRLVGYSSAGWLNQNLPPALTGYEPFYPKPVQAWQKLTSQLDLVMSARCIAAILGGDPGTASLPGAVPAELAGMVQKIARSDPAGAVNTDAWTMHEELGQIARNVFGAPRFIPVVMPPDA